MREQGRQGSSGSGEVNRVNDQFPQLQSMIRSLSCVRFATISGLASVSLGEDPPADDFIYGSHLSIIQVAAKELRMTFKAHFNLDEIGPLTQAKGSELRTQREVLLACYDLFKEYNNLVGGAISRQLQTCDIVAGLSLPLAGSGFNEVIGSDELRPQRLHDYWRVQGDTFAFVCSVTLDILQGEKLASFKFSDETIQDEGGEVEIL